MLSELYNTYPVFDLTYRCINQKHAPRRDVKKHQEILNTQYKNFILHNIVLKKIVNDDITSLDKFYKAIIISFGVGVKKEKIHDVIKKLVTLHSEKESYIKIIDLSTIKYNIVKHEPIIGGSSINYKYLYFFLSKIYK
jgi:hypothetical protein